MKLILFLAIASLGALLTGCGHLPGEGRVAFADGANVAYEDPSTFTLGGRHTVAHSLDTIVLTNDTDNCVMDFYEQGSLLWKNVPPDVPHRYHPSTDFRNFPVVFRSVIYRVDRNGKRHKVGYAEKIVRINQFGGPIVVSWDVTLRGVITQSDQAYSWY
ncbi:MAG TPA: hypothetical protein VFT82_02685 [Candidatus Paceibacterota bacterium]|nr:hypothetical protein [Candidatus Paceibacterota bacterium]